MDSGFGRYLSGKLPKAIANEFLYYQPSVLLWADELVCDKHALVDEAAWAESGFLASQLSIRLHDKRIIVAKDFKSFFQGESKASLLRASESDSLDSQEAGLVQYSTPDPGEVGQYSPTGFHDVNALLYLSTILGIPHLNTAPATKFYGWKFSRLAKSRTSMNPSTPLKPDDRDLHIFSEILSISVPSFELFPRNDYLASAEAAKQSLLSAATAYSRGDITAPGLDKEYRRYLDQWLRYDRSVRSEVLDNFEILMEFRNDKKLRSLRSFLRRFSENITRQPDNDDFGKEVALRFRREIMEVERAIAQESSTFKFLDKCNSYVSFPIKAAGVVAGIAASVLAKDPLFIALGNAPSFVKWAADGISEARRRRFSWHLYLLDFNKKIERAKELRALDKGIQALASRF